MKFKLPFGRSKEAKSVPKAQFKSEPTFMSDKEQRRIRDQMEGEIAGSREAREAEAEAETKQE
jgi:hypothetical protein